MQNRSSKIADLIKICFGIYLLTPTETRWNSTYDSVKFFLKNSKSKSGQLFRLCDDIDIVRFNKNDIEFLEEYTQIMEPLAFVLDHFGLGTGIQLHFKHITSNNETGTIEIVIGIDG